MSRDFTGRLRVDPANLNLDLDSWNNDWVECIFDIVWRAYDKLKIFYKSKSRKVKKEIEDHITSSLLRFINHIKFEVLDGYSTGHFRQLDFQNQAPDKSGKRKSTGKTNDIGVFFAEEMDTPRFIFEAKKIITLTDKGIASYIEDLDAFLEDYYGSHLSESALIAYLHIGTPKALLDLIHTAIKVVLQEFPPFLSRPHKISTHTKTVDPANRIFQCHHLVFEMF